MSTIKRYKNYEIVAESWETRYSWGHTAKLFKECPNGDIRLVNKSKARYYNRTWESYQYQSVMRSVVYEEMQYIIDLTIDNYKYFNNVKRLTAAKKQAIIDEVKATDEDYITLKEFYNTL